MPCSCGAGAVPFGERQVLLPGGVDPVDGAGPVHERTLAALHEEFAAAGKLALFERVNEAVIATKGLGSVHPSSNTVLLVALGLFKVAHWHVEVVGPLLLAFLLGAVCAVAAPAHAEARISRTTSDTLRLCFLGSGPYRAPVMRRWMVGSYGRNTGFSFLLRTLRLYYGDGERSSRAVGKRERTRSESGSVPARRWGKIREIVTSLRSVP